MRQDHKDHQVKVVGFIPLLFGYIRFTHLTITMVVKFLQEMMVFLLGLTQYGIKMKVMVFGTTQEMDLNIQYMVYPFPIKMKKIMKRVDMNCGVIFL